MFNFINWSKPAFSFSILCGAHFDCLCRSIVFVFASNKSDSHNEQDLYRQYLHNESHTIARPAPCPEHFQCGSLQTSTPARSLFSSVCYIPNSLSLSLAAIFGTLDPLSSARFSLTFAFATCSLFFARSFACVFSCPLTCFRPTFAFLSLLFITFDFTFSLLPFTFSFGSSRFVFRPPHRRSESQSHVFRSISHEHQVVKRLLQVNLTFCFWPTLHTLTLSVDSLWLDYSPFQIASTKLSQPFSGLFLLCHHHHYHHHFLLFRLLLQLNPLLIAHITIAFRTINRFIFPLFFVFSLFFSFSFFSLSLDLTYILFSKKKQVTTFVLNFIKTSIVQIGIWIFLKCSFSIPFSWLIWMLFNNFSLFFLISNYVSIHYEFT